MNATTANQAAERAVNNAWLTVAARLSAIMLVGIMIPTGGWVMLGLINSQYRIGLNEQRLTQAEIKSNTNSADIRSLAERVSQIVVAQRGSDEQLRNLNDTMRRIETRLDAALNGQVERP